MINPIDFDDENYKNHLLFLFADLYTLSHSILETIEKDDFIILIGDTPSYLSLFLKKNQYFILPFTNKPFGLIFPPLSNYDDKIDCDSKRACIPSKKNLLYYFNYLNNKTILTQEFMKKNWNKIVLIDTSSGQSIHGVSIFFNLYVGNLKIKTDKKCKDKGNDIDIKNIDSAKPLQFINLVSGDSKSFNIDPKVLKNKFEWDIRNFNPKLIIQISLKIFLFREFFIIKELFPRIAPDYSIRNWNTDPIIKLSKEVKEIKYIFDKLLKGLKKNNLSREENKYYLKIVKELCKNNKNNKEFITNNYKETMNNVFNIILNYKYLKN